MRSNKGPLGILLSLFLLVAAVWLWQRGGLFAEEVMDWDFAVPETERIQKIFLADRQGNTTTLERTGDHWTVNGTNRARPAAVEGLLQAISQVELKYIPPEEAVPPMIRSLATEGIKVEVYAGGDRPLQRYYVGGSTSDERGTYIIREGSEQPYVVHLPGWEGNLRFRFNLRGDDWRDRSVLAEEPGRIRSVTVNYPGDRDQSFRLNRRGDGFELTPFYSDQPKLEEKPRPGAAEAYLEGFRRFIAEDFRNQLPGKAELLATRPFCILRLERTDGSGKEIRFFPIRPDHAADPVMRYFAWVKGEDLFLVQFHLAEKYFWSYRSFVE